MAIIEVLLLDALRDVGVYAIARSVTGESTMQLRKRVADGEPLVVWDTNDFPSDSEHTEHHDQIRVSVSKLTSRDCDIQLFYRPSSNDDAEQISTEQL